MESGAIGNTLVAWQGWSMTSSTTALLIVLVWILTWLLPFPTRSLNAQLDDPQGRVDLRARLGEAGPLYRYRLAIRGLNGWLHDWFGEPTSGQALERCIAIAFVYPAALFVISVLLSATLSGRVALHELLIFAACVIVGVFITRRLFRLIYRLGTNFWRFIGGDSGLMHLIARVVLGAFAVIVAFAIAFVIATSIAGAFAEPGTMVLAILAAFTIAFALAGILAGAGPLAAAAFILTLTIAALAFAGEFAFILLLFFVLLPMVNALLDWLSWIVTRFFLRLVALVSDGIGGMLRLIGEIIGDILAAILFLLALAVLLPNGIEIINTLLGLFGREPFAWQALVTAARQNPLSEGLFVVGMLITTLVPTLVHLTVGLAGIIAAWTPGSAKAAAGLREELEPVFDSNGELVHTAIRPSVRQDARRALILARLWYVPSFMVAVGVFFGIAALLSALDLPPGQLLEKLALCSSAWSHGQCP
jgi:hypothetical protein